MATRKIFAVSSMPNHRMTSGMMARCGTLRSICSEKSSSVSAGREMPLSDAEHEADAAADQQPLQGASGADRHVMEEDAAPGVLPEGDRDRARRGQQPRRDRADLGGRLPDRDQRHRHRPWGEVPGRRASQRARQAHDCALAAASRAVFIGDGLAERPGVAPPGPRAICHAPAAAAGKPARRSGRLPPDAGSRTG